MESGIFDLLRHLSANIFLRFGNASGMDTFDTKDGPRKRKKSGREDDQMVFGNVAPRLSPFLPPVLLFPK